MPSGTEVNRICKERKSVKKICIFLMLLSCVTYVMPLFAQDTPEAARQDAYNNVKVAFGLVGQAQKVLTPPVTPEAYKTAVGLYIQAGEIFEKSETVFRSLGVKYVAKEDLDNCTRAKEDCIATIEKLKESLNR